MFSGEALLLTGDPVNATFTAETDSVILELSQQAFAGFLADNWKLVSDLSDFLAQHVRAV